MDHREYVGPPDRYDLIGANQFNALTYLGLRERHDLLDIGCGSLRAGRLFLAYLLPDRYFGVEPNRWLVEEGIRHEVGEDLVRIKRPTFSYDGDFQFEVFDRTFDFLLAHSILTHSGPDLVRRCLCQASKVMGPRSYFAATYRRGAADCAVDGWCYPGTREYTEEGMRAMAADARLRLEPLKWPHPNGQNWIVLTPKEGK